ncbi:hypothetical protein [Halegenticoccus tardaugens]|uniref:hypothetical protein n=1 Tax=Halegenticoccus tardaugens TaxID=2071624 RepID=UPI00100BD5D0|nr:hypothetical protein [Halegenticoccus tardaugens]
MTPTETPRCERTLGRFTEWLRRRPNSLEFWEVVVTDERLLLCFVGESFSSALLRADTGETRRRRLDGRAPADLLAAHERNAAVPLDSLRSIRLRRGSRLRRASLRFEWEADGRIESLDLRDTKAGDEQADLVAALAADDRLSHVDVAVEKPRFGLF